VVFFDYGAQRVLCGQGGSSADRALAKDVVPAEPGGGGQTAAGLNEAVRARLDSHAAPFGSPAQVSSDTIYRSSSFGQLNDKELAEYVYSYQAWLTALGNNLAQTLQADQEKLPQDVVKSAYSVLANIQDLAVALGQDEGYVTAFADDFAERYDPTLYDLWTQASEDQSDQNAIGTQIDHLNSAAFSALYAHSATLREALPKFNGAVDALNDQMDGNVQPIAHANSAGEMLERIAEINKLRTRLAGDLKRVNARIAARKAIVDWNVQQGLNGYAVSAKASLAPK
jgi:hypothetical protein